MPPNASKLPKSGQFVRCIYIINSTGAKSYDDDVGAHVLDDFYASSLPDGERLVKIYSNEFY